MRVVLAIPPHCQRNTPFPSTAYLARCLRDQGVEVQQRELGIELVLRVFSRDGLHAVFDQLEARSGPGAPCASAATTW